jgi:hypothetical protein
MTMYHRTVTTALFVALLGATPTFAQQPAAEAPPTSAMTTRQREWLKSTISERVRLAERLGEEGARAFAKKKGYAPLLMKADKVLVQGLDQVWRAKDGTIVVLEAKGGTSAIGRGYGCQQGTPEWAVQAAKRVAASPKASAAEKQAARLVLEAARDGRLTVQVVRTRHVLGEPVAAVLESTLKAGQSEGKAAAAMLEETVVATKAARAVARMGTSAEATGKAVAGASTLAKVGKAAGVVGVAVDGAIRVNAAVETEKKYQAGELTGKERVTAHAKNAAGMAGGLGGAWVGAKGGAAAGGAVGAFFGGVGAPIGAVIGGGVGAVGGYFGGEYLGEKLINGVRWLWR